MAQTVTYKRQTTIMRNGCTITTHYSQSAELAAEAGVVRLDPMGAVSEILLEGAEVTGSPEGG